MPTQNSQKNGLFENPTQEKPLKMLAQINKDQELAMALTEEDGLIEHYMEIKRNLSQKLSTPNQTITAKDGKIIRTSNTYFNYGNAQYLIKLGIGNPNHKYKFILDTGSTTLLLITSKCTKKACLEHKPYNPSQKSKVKETKQ